MSHLSKLGIYRSTTWRLFLDDIRLPPKDRNGVPEPNWRVARNVDQAINLINSLGLPYEISFDHDLGEDLSGYDFAKWLVEYCQYHELAPSFKYTVHSMNPVGAKNITGLLEGYKKFYNDQRK